MLKLVATTVPQVLAGAISTLDGAVADARPEDLPGLIGELARLYALALARVVMPGAVHQDPPKPDENLDVLEAARRLGVSPDWLYRHSRTLPFAVRIGRRLLFSARGLERWNRQRQG